MASFGGAVVFVLFLALSPETSCFPTGTNLRNFSRAVLSLTNDTLGVGYMKVNVHERHVAPRVPLLAVPLEINIGTCSNVHIPTNLQINLCLRNVSNLLDLE